MFRQGDRSPQPQPQKGDRISANQSKGAITAHQESASEVQAETF